ncbi:MAG: twin-arginine translocase TatA/TatE family subunit [Haloarculaceae archaeon]
MFGTLPLFPGIPGGPELLVILLIAVLLFGANKIPKLARSSGEAIGEFQKGREEVEQELEEIRQKKSENRTEEERARLEEDRMDEDATGGPSADDRAEADLEAEKEN